MMAMKIFVLALVFTVGFAAQLDSVGSMKVSVHVCTCIELNLQCVNFILTPNYARGANTQWKLLMGGGGKCKGGMSK